MDVMKVKELVVFMVVPTSVYAGTFRVVRLLAKKDILASMPNGYKIDVYKLEIPLDVERLSAECPLPHLLLPTGDGDDVKEVELTWLPDLVIRNESRAIPRDFDGYSVPPLDTRILQESLLTKDDVVVSSTKDDVEMSE